MRRCGCTGTAAGSPSPKPALEARTATAADWWTAFTNGDSALLLAHRRSHVDTLNDLARELMAADGRLSGPVLDLHGRSFQVGDRIVCGLNRPSLRIANGTRGLVTALDATARTLTVKTDAGHEVTLPADYLGKELGKGRRPVDHGYAITGHKAEGVTVDRVFIVGSGPSQEWMYVASTRPKVRADFYLVEAPEPPQLTDEIDLPPPTCRDPYDIAIAAMGRPAPQRLAIDDAAETNAPTPAPCPQPRCDPNATSSPSCSPRRPVTSGAATTRSRDSSTRPPRNSRWSSHVPLS